MMTIQIQLSKLLDSVQGIGAGIFVLRDIINVNKKTDYEEVRAFFQVMEVFGQQADLWVSRIEVINDSSESSDF